MDQQLRPVGQIAGHKNVLGRGRSGLGITFDRPPVGQNKAVALRVDKGDVEGLADGDQHVVAFHEEVRPLDRNRPSAAAGVGLAQFHLLAPNTPYFTALVLLDAHRIGQQMKVDTLFVRLVDFRLHSRHFGPAAAVDDVDFPPPEP